MVETKFKQTDVGLIPEDWGVKSIGEITIVSAGGTPNTRVAEFWGGAIPWMNSGELNLKRVDNVEGRITEQGLKNSSTHLIPPYCVLIGLAGQGKTRGTAAYNTISLCTNQSIAAIYPSVSFSSVYAYYYFDSIYDRLRFLSEGGGGRGGLTKKLLENFLIPLPSLKEQERIASALTSIDNLISSLDKQIAKTRHIKQGAMRQLLTFPDNVPLRPLGEVYNRLHGTPITAGIMQNIANPAGDIIIYAGGKTVVNAFEEDIPNANITRVPAVLIQSRGVVDAVYCDKPFTFKNEMWAYTCDNTISLQYLCYYLKHNIEYFRMASERSGMPQISLKETETYLIPVPSIEEQQRIASTLTAMDNQIAALEAKRRKYEMLKQGMMQQLLTGKIRLGKSGIPF